MCSGSEAAGAVGRRLGQLVTWRYGGVATAHGGQEASAGSSSAARVYTTGPPAHGRAAVDAEREGSQTVLLEDIAMDNIYRRD